uniref:Uncharacterized protein n=1 Tax=Candidatus Kentrum eta TaxID=2126337 RepID=A0A450UNT2_9GAMM|nr:MAG: hypothetical protein BECKH772A_GA0070896_1005613 [Candidatus Kentron sp. H]VFJ94120.1 MAG: hypothetical protein BECKH772B_GA0070898_1005514 [Candidatus Kentron sp. H]VFK06775.1 MAG: hypothetical protein BECKH772C_GA0070978_103731 [Candidatus Kentron sp. H]
MPINHINPECLETLWVEYAWLAPLVLYAAYLGRYFLVRRPLRTGLYNDLVSDLHEPEGREAAIGKIGAPNRWRTFYRDSLDGLPGFFDRVFGEGGGGIRACCMPAGFGPRERPISVTSAIRS